jgi:hypothetical protein
VQAVGDWALRPRNSRRCCSCGSSLVPQFEIMPTLSIVASHHTGCDQATEDKPGKRGPYKKRIAAISVFAASCGKWHQKQTHRHRLCSIIFILQKMSNRLSCSRISTCLVFLMKKGNGPGGLVREERLQIMLSPEELAVVDTFRFQHRMPSRAAAVRELFRLGIAAAGAVVDNAGIKSSDYGVLKTPKNLTKLR